MSEDVSMWKYLKEKYYHRVAALEACYPQTLANNVMLQLAVAQIKASETMIDTVMDKLQPEEEDDGTY